VSEGLENKNKILQCIEYLSSSENTVKDRVIKMNKNVHEHLKVGLYSCTYFYACLNERTSITCSAHLAVTIWFVKDNKVCEAVLKSATLSVQLG
jgi:hypothetical protein